MYPISRRALLCTTLALAGLPLGALAQDYPARAITIVVPFSAGGGVDTMARLLADRLRVSLKQSVVVDNKPGASGMLGAGAVAKAPPDGYTLLLGSAGETAINPLIYKEKMQYVPARDLAPITAVTRVPNVLVTHPNFPAKSVAELVAHAQKNPGKLTYATSGVGNPQHLNGELLQMLTGVKMQHVPYKGAANQLVDVAAGNVDITFVSLAGATPFIKGGRVKALAVTSAKRAGFAPEIPAIAEFAPAAAYDLDNWFGLFAPAKTPPAVLDKLHAAVTAALREPELIKRLREQGGEPMPLSPAAFRQFMQTETAKYARIVDSAHIVNE